MMWPDHPPTPNPAAELLMTDVAWPECDGCENCDDEFWSELLGDMRRDG